MKDRVSNYSFQLCMKHKLGWFFFALFYADLNTFILHSTQNCDIQGMCRRYDTRSCVFD